MATPQYGVFAPQRQQSRNEIDHQLAIWRFGQLPIRPGNFVILTIGVVIALLRPSEFIACEKHWRPVREENRCQHRAAQSSARLVDIQIVCRALDTPIRRIILGTAIAIIFAIRFVMALCVTDGVHQREAIVGSCVIDRCPGSPRAAIEKIARPGEPCGKIRALPWIAAPKSPEAVSIAIIPFGEPGRMLSKLIAAGTDVPRLRYKLHTRQKWILPQGIEKPGARIKSMAFAAERYAEVETEAVDMKRRYPIAQ